jgi:tetratricopeptide (TPR) repeat protein
MPKDLWDLPLSTESPSAAEQYVLAVEKLLSANVGAEEALGRAIGADPGFALAHAARARALQLRGALPEARAAAARAVQLAPSATRRERGHIEALALNVEPDMPRTLAHVQEHLREFPRDGLVLSLASGIFGLIGFSGRRDRNEMQLALLDGLAVSYGDDWWFLTIHGFACTEADQRKRGRRLIERALALNPRNGHAAHGLAHVCYEGNASEEGTAFLRPWLADYDKAAQLHCHLSWHLALFELALGRSEIAWTLYDEHIRQANSYASPLITLSDSVSLLWRCRLWDKERGTVAWGELRDFARRSFPAASLAFADAHVVMACAAYGDRAGADARIDELRRQERGGRQPAGRVAADAAEALAAFARGDDDAVIRLLEPALMELVRVGGSHAQRDVFEDTLLGAYLRSGRLEAASLLFHKRLGRRPSGRDRSWLNPPSGPRISQ